MSSINDQTPVDQIVNSVSGCTVTGLPLRPALYYELLRRLSNKHRPSADFLVVTLDLDNFKRINHSIGEPGGNIVLCHIASRILEFIGVDDSLFRSGDDEFSAIVSGKGHRLAIEDFSMHLLKIVSRPIRIGHQTIIMTGCLGIAAYPRHRDAATLMKAANLALCEAKERGRNVFAVYDNPDSSHKLDLLRMEFALRGAIAANELEIVYQPQVSMISNCVIGVEALLRWHSPLFGTVMPNTFIPIAEETGLIVPISEWVLRKACKEVAELQKDTNQTLTLSVNISPCQFQHSNFSETVSNALRLSQFPAHQLELEITERLLMVNSEESLETMRKVRTSGVRFAIDDFGTGFSNMAYIIRYAVHRIKVDRCFVKNCDLDPTSRAVIGAIIALAQTLGIEVIAEGVETTRVLGILRELKCEQAQGFLYSMPLSRSALTAFVMASGLRLFVPPGESGIRLAFDTIRPGND